MGKWNVDTVRQYIEKLDYKLISTEYITSKSKIDIQDSEGYSYKTTFDNLKNVKSLEKFHVLNPFTIQNIKHWLKINNKPFELLSDKYEGNNKKLQWKCLKEDCGEVYESLWSNVSHSTNPTGCPYCVGNKVCLSNCLVTKRPDLASEWHSNKNGDLTPYDVTCGCGKKVWWVCEKGHEWKTTINKRNHLERGCPKCKKSKGENKIDTYLTLNNYIFDREYIFKDLLSDFNYPLRFDFAIFEDKDKTELKCLIEYDGEFHYKKYFDEQNYDKQQIYDKRKNEYCLNKNIKLIRIPYWKFDNIEKILEKELQL
jgi:hypothetical protein